MLALPRQSRQLFCALLLAAASAMSVAQPGVTGGLGEVSRAEQSLSQGQPYVTLAAETLAGFYYRAGNYVLAEPLYKRVLDADPKRYGQLPDEPTMVLNLQNLALLYQEQGRLQDALPMLIRALNLEERAAGRDHPDVATAMSLLAGLSLRLGQYAEAEGYYREALAIDEAALGLLHSSIAATANNLGAALAMQRRYDEAEPLLRRAQALYGQMLGPDSPDAQMVARNLGVLLTQKGRGDEGAALFAGLLALYNAESAAVEGPTQPALARDLRRLAGLYVAQGDLQNAEPLYKRALQVTRLVFGETHAFNAGTLVELGELYEHLALHALAAPQYQEALQLYEALPATDPQILTALRARLAQLLTLGDDGQ